MNRRNFITLISTTLGLGAASCKPPDERIVPVVEPSSEVYPGVPNYYTSVFTMQNVAYGTVIKTYDGRPVKIDGNELHPASRGKSSAIMQYQIYSLYDSKRLRKPHLGNEAVKLEDTIQTIINNLKSAFEKNKKVGIIIEQHCSPALNEFLIKLSNDFPLVINYVLSTKQSQEAGVNKLLCGIDGEFAKDFRNKEYIFSLGWDFLGEDKYSLYNVHQYFSLNKKPKLFVAESNMTVTGAKANERLALRPDEYESFLADILLHILIKNSDKEISELIELIKPIRKNNFAITETIAKNLLAYKSLILIEADQSPIAHCLGAILNYFINSDKTFLKDIKLLPFSANHNSSRMRLIDDLTNHSLESLIIINADNIIANDKQLIELLKKYDTDKKISFSLYETDFSKTCGLSIPTSHWLESWGDAISIHGGYSIQQPIIAPINQESEQFQDVLLKVFQIITPGFLKGINSYYDFIRRYYAPLIRNEEEWEQVLKDGVFYDTDNLVRRIGEDANKNINMVNAKKVLSEYKYYGANNRFQAIFVNSNEINEDIFFPNPLLKELPGSMTKLTWHSAALLNPAEAGKLGIENGDNIKIETGNKEIKLPVLIIDGIAPQTIILPAIQRNILAKSVQINSSDYRTNNLPYISVEIKKTNNKTKLALVQKQNYLFESGTGRFNSLKYYFRTAQKPIFNNNENTKDNKWVMAIDIDKCNGCGSCVAACQIENNIPVVGKEEVLNGRIMHWLRLDRYFLNPQDINNPKPVWIPVPCQQCDNAPCESVCPVSASTHSPDGLNETTYSRCIGSRYCMVNCPYKVRRFNFYDYHKGTEKSLELMNNPELLRRMRGVVEKCSFCIHRIRQEKLKIKDFNSNGEMIDSFKTACQAACPSNVIIFGDLNNHKTQVSKLLSERNSFHLLGNLNTKPSIYYLSELLESEYA
ncbi:MAG: Molybdopterin oxidoreductase [Ignavibacteria bacterium]|nr:Molybdopterin oxidoreductase [Ignavibacteria bacterium]